MRIAIDVDSTLHQYWDLLSDAAKRRFGIELPYDEQYDWGITRLRPEQLHVCIEETHRDAVIEASEPYPHAVDTVRAWHEAGHFIHITSHRADSAHAATVRWLERIGLPFDEVYCSFDKVSHCCEIGIDLLIDDAPLNITSALDKGIAVATIAHPWNRDVCEEEDVICVSDWAELRERLAALLGVPPRAPAEPR